MKRIFPIMLVVGATLRLTRFIVSDTLGEWLIVRPAKRWGEKADIQALNEAYDLKQAGFSARSDELYEKTQDEEPLTPQSKLVSGLECPFCVGFWVGLIVLIADRVLPRRGILRTLWNVLTSALSLNYLTGHISARID